RRVLFRSTAGRAGVGQARLVRLHRRRTLVAGRAGRLLRLGPVGADRRGTAHPRRVPEPRGRRPPALRDLLPRPGLGSVHRGAGGGLPARAAPGLRRGRRPASLSRTTPGVSPPAAPGGGSRWTRG